MREKSGREFVLFQRVIVVGGRRGYISAVWGNGEYSVMLKGEHFSLHYREQDIEPDTEA